MHGYTLPFKGKKITLLGLGLLGRGVGDAAFLSECGANVTVTDTKSAEQLAESLERLKTYPNIIFHLGGHTKTDFEQCDLVIKSAGVRLDSPEIAAAHAAGVPVAMSTALFAKYAMDAGATIVGVTGTRGKTTVSHMIFHALQKRGKRVHLGGNVRGISTLAMLPDIETGDIAVLELDSWQLQGFGDLKISPHVSVFTNLMPDHQNYYPDMDTYFADKANIFRYQKEDDALFVGRNIFEKIKAPQTRIPEMIPADWKLNILGEHNRENASFAAAALRALGLSDAEIKPGIESFEGVEGRLEFVRESNGVKFYNDNNATTPEATLAALTALRESRITNHEMQTILIVGGSDKGLHLGMLADEINRLCKAVILLSGTGTDKLVPLLDSKFMIHDSSPCDSLKVALAKAIKVAAQGDVILFSPAFASFGMFKNEYDRNDQFLELVRQMGDAA